jgi:hypothetical protein
MSTRRAIVSVSALLVSYALAFCATVGNPSWWCPAVSVIAVVSAVLLVTAP